MPPEPPYADAFRGTTVLVTGGAGFIGSHLARRLAALGAATRVLDDLSTGRAESLDGAEVDLRVGSILDDDALDDVAAGCDLVFHQAAMVSVPQSVEQPRRCIEVNVAGTQRVLEAARRHGARRVLLAASAAAYGDAPTLPSRETDRVACCSPYAASKVGGELLMSAFAHSYAISTASLRYFNVFGPRQDPHSPYAAAIAAFLDAAAAGRPATLFGDGRQTRDFVFVDNVVHANLLAASARRNLRGEVINVGTGRRISLLDVIAELGRIHGRAIEPVVAPPRAGDVRDSTADITRARELLDYEPIVSFEEGLRAMVG